MKRILLFALCCVTVTNGTTRRIRDVSEIDTNASQNYLPPKVEIQSKALENLHTTMADDSEIVVASQEKHNDDVDDATVVGPQGYEYKSVRRLRFRNRNRRDVSHLSREYLPPTPVAPIFKQPAIEYLPPTSVAPIIKQPANEYLPPVEPSRPPKLTNEYLPPPLVKESHIEVTTEVATTEAPAITTTLAPITTTLATTTTTEIITEAPATLAPIIVKELSEAEEDEDKEEETAILADDGYHYKKPAVIPDLSPIREYLPPPLQNDEEDSIIVDGPAEETSVLSDDGYHYRAIRRFRF